MKTTNSIRINVTRKDIDAGIEGDGNPIYLALQRTFPNSRIKWGPHLITIKDQKGSYLIYATPKDVRGWLEAFEAGAAVEPITFEL